ncbi:MAG: hypothetical protein V1867_03460 [Candidatus Falkowbacteria bacterium]
MFSVKSHFVVFILLSLVFLAFIQTVSADGGKEALDGLNITAKEGYGTVPRGTVSATIGKIVGSILAFTGIIFFLLVIYGGFTWMMARGNEQEVAKAKSLIEQAAIGLIIVLAAYALTAFIGRALTSPT